MSGVLVYALLVGALGVFGWLRDRRSVARRLAAEAQGRAALEQALEEQRRRYEGSWTSSGGATRGSWTSSGSATRGSCRSCDG
jgi:hypothetical protein